MIEETICVLIVPLSVVVGEERGKEEENNLKSANKAAAPYLLNKSCQNSSACPPLPAQIRACRQFAVTY